MTAPCEPAPASALERRAVARYDVAGFRLLVLVQPGAGPVAGILAPIERLLGRFRSAVDDRRDAGAAWILRIGRAGAGPAESDEGLRRVWEGPSPAGFHVINSVAAGRRRCELVGVGTLDVDLSSRTASIRLLAETPANSVHYFLTTILCDGLMDTGHCVVHAACLEKSTARGRRSVLIVARSGTGKSTTSLAMTSAGWRLMGDDIAVLTPTPDGLRVWGFPRFCNVRRPTLALLPWLAGMPLVPTSVPDTFALPLEHLGDRVSCGVPEPAEPAAIICLERPNALGHRLEPLDRAAALMHVAEENVQPIDGAGDTAASRAFGAFAELVRIAPAYALSAGPQLDRIGGLIDEHLSL